MRGLDLRCFRKRCDRARYACDANATATRERKAVDCVREQLGRGFGPARAHGIHAAARRLDSPTHRCGRFPRRRRQLGRTRPRHRHREIEAVEQGTRKLLAVRGKSLRRARALDRRIAAGAAGAHVHRSDELESRGEDRVPANPRDRDDAILERLAKRLQNGPRKLG